MLVNLNLDNKQILVLGAGKVGLRKTKKLLAYTNQIAVVSEHVLDEFYDLNINVIKDSYDDMYLKNIDIIFLCTDNNELHDEIIDKLANCHILINNCMSKTNMDFMMVNTMIDNEVEIGVYSKKGIKHNKQILDKVTKRK